VAKAIEWHLQEKRTNTGVGPATGGENSKIRALLTRVSLSESQKQANQDTSVPIFLRGACPECGGPLLYEEGCVKCLCGYSDCG
jgi:hypothetical protein